MCLRCSLFVGTRGGYVTPTRLPFAHQEDIHGAKRLLMEMSNLPDDEGWRRLQSRVRGARTIDVAEWREVTNHEYVGHGRASCGDAGHARACVAAPLPYYTRGSAAGILSQRAWPGDFAAC